MEIVSLSLFPIKFNLQCAMINMILSKKSVIKILSICSLIIFSAQCRAQELSSATRQEIEYLFAHLQNSGCQFHRNGSWYSAAEAVDHLRKKYEYLKNKNLLTTSESFIEKAATESSMSGKPYQVKCEGQAVVLSSLWFKTALSKHRENK